MCEKQLKEKKREAEHYQNDLFNLLKAILMRWEKRKKQTQIQRG